LVHAIFFHELPRTSAGEIEIRGNQMLKAKVRDFLHDERGATAIEYALIAGIVSISIVFALTQISGSLQSMFGKVNAGFNP